MFFARSRLTVTITTLTAFELVHEKFDLSISLLDSRIP
jgi:hypothetical protein